MSNHSYFDELMERNAELRRENERLTAKLKDYEWIYQWALYGLWEASFKDDERGEMARQLWSQLTGQDLQGKA